MFAFLLPTAVSASVKITEVMYDLPGSDSGREWIEVTNTGAEAVDIAGFRLFEADTNHKLKSIQGGTLLLPGSSAVIASNAARFLTEYTTYTGILFDSTFSLSNTGETVAIKNTAGVVEDSISYTAPVQKPKETPAPSSQKQAVKAKSTAASAALSNTPNALGMTPWILGLIAIIGIGIGGALLAREETKSKEEEFEIIT